METDVLVQRKMFVECPREGWEQRIRGLIEREFTDDDGVEVLAEAVAVLEMLAVHGRMQPQDLAKVISDSMENLLYDMRGGWGPDGSQQTLIEGLGALLDKQRTA